MLRTVVVDDDQSVRRLLGIVLPLDRHVKVVGEAEDGSSAVAIVNELRPDVVILDHRMPGQTGAQIVPMLKQIVPKADIIFFSAYADSESDNLFEAAKDHGCYLLAKGGTTNLELLLKKLNRTRRVGTKAS